MVDFSRCLKQFAAIFVYSLELEIKKAAYSAALFPKSNRLLAVQNVHRNFETETHIGKFGFAPSHGFLHIKKLLVTT
ncbi:MAG: hypothetical protein ACREUI_09030 [Burkholderiales bacterium]